MQSLAEKHPSSAITCWVIGSSNFLYNVGVIRHCSHPCSNPPICSRLQVQRISGVYSFWKILGYHSNILWATHKTNSWLTIYSLHSTPTCPPITKPTNLANSWHNLAPRGPLKIMKKRTRINRTYWARSDGVKIVKYPSRGSGHNCPDRKTDWSQLTTLCSPPGVEQWTYFAYKLCARVSAMNMQHEWGMYLTPNTLSTCITFSPKITVLDL